MRTFFSTKNMGFKKAIVCLLLFGVAVLLIQMLALSNLNVQGSSKRPWEEASVSLNTGIKEEVRRIV